MDNQRITVKIPQHRHCQVCGKAIKERDEMCSDACKKEWDKTIKRKKLWLWAYGAVAVVVAMMAMLAFR